MAHVKLRILLVDDHAVVRAGFRYLLDIEKKYDILEAGSAEEACKNYHSICPDLVLLDMSMPGIGGIEGLQRLRKIHAEAKILVLSMFDDPAYVARAMEIGAQGYISKTSAAESLAIAVATVLDGKQYFSPEIESQMLQQSQVSDCGTLSLSIREFEVFRFIAEGRSLNQIAEVLNLSPKTVSNHRSHIMEKLELKNTADLVRFAIRQDIIKA